MATTLVFNKDYGHLWTTRDQNLVGRRQSKWPCNPYRYWLIKINNKSYRQCYRQFFMLQGFDSNSLLAGVQAIRARYENKQMRP